jgi:riboflavin synthase
MFTGITQGLFLVNSLTKREGLLHYTVILNESLVQGLKIGASVAIDGVCQTVVAINGFEVGFDAISETLRKTNLQDLFVNRKVSVERSVCFGDEMGGHEVSGHIFEKGVVVAREAFTNNLCLTIRCSTRCLAFIKPKGFIAVDGSSLTVSGVDKTRSQFEFYLVPETLRVTNFSTKAIGSYVNLEPDMKTMILVETVQNYFSDMQVRLEKIEQKLGLKKIY